MGEQGRSPTLGQLLQQARLLQGLSLGQAAARLHREDGSSISPRSLRLLEQARRRPSLHLTQELATVLALDRILLLTYAHHADAVLRRYLHVWPERESGLIEMLLTAEQYRFVHWERVTRQIIVPAASAPFQRRSPVTRAQPRR